MEADTILIQNLLDSRDAKQIQKESKFVQTVL